VKHKVFTLTQGKLSYTGLREIQEGDAILEGATSMSEVGLVEASTSAFPGYFGVGPTKQELKAARVKIAEEHREALKASFKRLNPKASDKELDILVSGKVRSETWLR
jgi:hypothetical protein